MTRKYITDYNTLTLSLGRGLSVRFEADTFDQHGRFITSDANIIEQLESHPYFVSGAVRFEQQMEEKTPPKTKKDTKEHFIVSDVRSVQGARDYIRNFCEQNNYPYPTIRTRADVLSFSDSNGIAFPNL